MTIKDLQEAWKNRGQIATGIWNRYLNKEATEQMYQERLAICTGKATGIPCENYTENSDGCWDKMLTPPCCNKNVSGCGCKLEYSLRVHSKPCPIGKFPAVLSEEDQKLLDDQLYKQQFENKNNQINGSKETGPEGGQENQGIQG